MECESERPLHFANDHQEVNTSNPKVLADIGNLRTIRGTACLRCDNRMTFCACKGNNEWIGHVLSGSFVEHLWEFSQHLSDSVLDFVIKGG